MQVSAMLGPMSAWIIGLKHFPEHHFLLQRLTFLPYGEGKLETRP